MASRDIVVRIITDLAALRSGMQQATGVIAGAASKARGLSSALGGIERTARSAGMQLALIGGAGVAAFGLAAKGALDMERTMARTVGLTSLTREEVEKVSERIKAIAPGLGIPVQELADAFYFAVSAVGDTDKALRILDVAGKASAAGLGDLTTVVDGVSSAVNAYGEDVLSAERATDIFVSAVKEGKMPPEAFAGSIGKVLPIASALGLSFEEVAANMSIMTRVGMDAATASTSLKAVMTQLLKPSTEAEELIASLGLTFGDLRESIAEEGLLATLQNLIDLTGGETDQLAILFPNVRALTDVLGSAVAQGETYAGVLERTNDSTGLTTEAFGEMAMTVSHDIDRLKAMISVLKLEIGEILLPIINKMVDNLQRMISEIRKFTKEHPKLTEFLVTFGAIGSVLALVTGAFLLFVSVVAGGLKALVDLAIIAPKVATALWNVSAALAQGAIHAGTFAVKMAAIGWDALKTSIGKAGSAMWNFTRGLQAAIRSDTAKLRVDLDKAFGTKQISGAEKAGVSIGAAIRGVTKGAFQGIGAGLGIGFVSLLKDPKVIAGLSRFAVGLAGLFSSAISFAMTLATNPIFLAVAAALIAAFLIYKYRAEIWDGLTKLFDILKEFFTDALPTWFRQNFTAANIGRIVGMAAGILMIAMFPIPFLIIKFRSQIMGFLMGVGSFVAGIPAKIVAFIGDHWKMILFALFPVPAAIIEFREEIGGFLADIMSFVAGIPGKIAAFVADHWKEILFALFPVPMAVIKWREDIAEWLVKIAGFVAGIPGKIAAFIGENWKDILGAIIDIPKWSVEFGNKATAFVADILPRIPGWFASIGSAIAGAIKAAFLSLLKFDEWLRSALTAAWNKLPGPVRDFLGGVGGGFGKVMDWAGLQKGVLNFIGGLALIGEHGPELMRLPPGTDVIRNENMRQAIRDLDGTKAGGNFSLAVNIAANFGNWAELRRQIMEDVEEHLDDAAAEAGLSQPRYGTLGAGVPRT